MQQPARDRRRRADPAYTSDMPDRPSARSENSGGIDAIERRILARFLENAAPSKAVPGDVVDRIRLLVKEGRVPSVEELLVILSEASSDAAD